MTWMGSTAATCMTSRWCSLLNIHLSSAQGPGFNADQAVEETWQHSDSSNLGIELHGQAPKGAFPMIYVKPTVELMNSTAHTTTLTP